MKHFKKQGKPVKEHLESLSSAEIEKLEAEVKKNGSAKLEVCGLEGSPFTLLPEHMVVERKVEKKSVNHFIPGVVEPSFGIDRILFSIFEHSYYARPKGEGEDEKQTRGVLRLSPSIAPYKCAILPLDQRVSKSPEY